MDRANLTLLLALVAAACAAFISSWLLYVMMPPFCFASLVIVNLAGTSAGLYLPYRCTRQSLFLVMPTANIIWGTLISLTANTGVLLLDLTVVQKAALGSLVVDEFIRALVALAGFGMATSLVMFLSHYIYINEGQSLRRLRRQVLKQLVGVGRAQLQVCDDLEASCPGECSICLDDLFRLPEELAFSPAKGSKVADVAGLLKLPCGHAFHGICAESWFAREVTCPMCRGPIGSIAKCRRICLKLGSKNKGGELSEGDLAKGSEEVDGGTDPCARSGSVEPQSEEDRPRLVVLIEDALDSDSKVVTVEI